jgi:hypothetical protein
MTTRTKPRKVPKTKKALRKFIKSIIGNRDDHEMGKTYIAKGSVVSKKLEVLPDELSKGAEKSNGDIRENRYTRLKTKEDIDNHFLDKDKDKG